MEGAQGRYPSSLSKLGGVARQRRHFTITHWHQIPLTGRKSVVVLDNVGRKTRAFHLPVPQFLDGPALHPLDHTDGAHHEINGYNDEPNKHPGFASGNA